MSADNFPSYPGWRTVRLLGRGSFGAVYEIERQLPDLVEKAALKWITIPRDSSEIDELYSDGYDERSITARFQSYLQDIIREYSLMAKMKGCSNIVYCDDVKYVQHDRDFGWDIMIKMELLTPLTAALGKELTEAQVLKIASDLCSALSFCEKRGVLHRDIKPQNIFVSPDGTCKLGDFGVAKAIEKTSGGTVTGKYKYMAPEVYNNQPYGTRADLYSLGLLLYWLLNERRLPFYPPAPERIMQSDEEQARARRFRGEPIPPPRHGSEGLKRIVLKACTFRPEERFADADEMLAALEQLRLGRGFAGSGRESGQTGRSDTTVSARRGQHAAGTRYVPPADEEDREESARARRQAQPEPPRKKHPGLVAAAILLALALAVTAGLLLRGALERRREAADEEDEVQETTARPRRTPAPESEPAGELSPEPTPEPTAEPTPEPTPEPTAEPTPEPTPEPTEAPLSGSEYSGTLSGYTELFFRSAYASSERVEGQSVYFASNVITPSSHRPWIEGASGQGIGESITLYFKETQTVSLLVFRLGYSVTDELYAVNNRPKQLEIAFSDGSSFVYTFEDANRQQLVLLSRPVETSYVMLTILDVYHPTDNDTCIDKVRAFR